MIRLQQPTRRRAAVRAIQTHLPERQLTNDELAREFGDWSVEKIHEKTGIAVRHIAAADECASDLGVAAAEKLFADGACRREDVDFLLFCTQSPDYFLPATACTMQHRLGLPTNCGALDFNQGCSGFVYGLSLAKGLIEANGLNNVLLITAETYSKHLHPRDKSVRTIFGDGAAATLVSAVDSERELLGPFVMGTDGAGADHLRVPAGCMRRPRTSASAREWEDDSGNVHSDDHLQMNGPQIFNFTLQAVPKMVNGLLERSRLTAADVDYFVFHQANRFMLEHLRKRLRIPPERFCINMESYGNTVSATIPMALETARAAGSVVPGSRLMLVGFGVGLSWAACLLDVC